ncbi:hypothetical protein QN277_014356 [Acacia crassicarpa]|uniref:Uncharacterized protein n=1 Tax=Acacia crassicarpa TaxID=499986 RepID=A0AAE1JJK5_9FABA|nr:hypothetical protein QN277_014356 [Acacia crassicarpa]
MAMRLSHALSRGPFRTTSSAAPSRLNSQRVYEFGNHGFRFLNCGCRCSTSGSAVSSAANPSSPSIASNSGVSREKPRLEAIEEDIEKVIYRCRFLAILGVFGSLIGSFLCFIKGCTFVAETFMLHLIDRSKVIPMLVEAIDVYLLGTVMLVFGMGLYELFVSNLGNAGSLPDQHDSYRSNLFGLFTLKERPKWLNIKTVNELKTKLGHVIVMLLLIGLFDKSKKAAIHTPVDLLCFCASVLLSSSCLFLLTKLSEDK